MKLGSVVFDGAFKFASRFEEGAAQADCFSVDLAAVSNDAGFPPEEIRTTVKVHLGDGPRINLIQLDTAAEVLSVDVKTFQEKVEGSKKNCPIFLALAGPEFEVCARLIQ